VGILTSPAEADSILVVDPDAVQSLEFPLEGFEPVARWDAKVDE
jgi:hypothetical protein